MPSIPLGAYVHDTRTGTLASTPYAGLADLDLAEFLAAWDDIHRYALKQLPARIDPTAEIHPTALIGDDVIIGPHVRVHEFTTVRKGSVLCAGVSVGFNCEVTKAFIAENTVLGHRISLGRTIVGAHAHLSANLTAAAISMWSPDMRHPEREIIIRTPDGIYRCGTPQFAALIGDHVQTGSNINLGPGAAIGRTTRIASGVTLAGRAIRADHVVTAPHTADAHMHRQRSCLAQPASPPRPNRRR